MSESPIQTNRLLKLLESGAIILGDGANGTLLSDLGFEKQPYDLANLLRPDLVLAAHQAYIAAGSDFIETNTFSANRHRLSDALVDIAEINRVGAQIARKAAGEKVVLGAIGPCGKPLEPIGSISANSAIEGFTEQARALAEGGVDGFILETFIDLEELLIATKAVRSVSQLPIVVSKAFIEDGDALFEGLPGRCATEMIQEGVVAIGANCVVGPQRMTDIVRQLAESCHLPVLAMPTPGLPQFVKGKVVYDIAPDYFARSAVRLAEEGASLIGGCCGTTPEHVAKMRALIDQGAVKPKHPIQSSRKQAERAPLAESEPTEFSEKLKHGKFVISVEMDLPRGLKVDNVLKGSRALKVVGADLIDISDGARARLRMNPLSVCKLVQDGVGIETMMHFACRDRNLLAAQADLLGAHALGIRNILAVTGDPANIGDYPSATSVFDIDAIGLVRILNRFNEGIDLAGYSIGIKCAFTVAIAFNPLAVDIDNEIDRLNRKLDAGAHVVYTQPLFETAHLDAVMEAVHRSKVPVLMGVLPLKHSRHAEFMHNEVPGIEVPDWLRARMASAPDETAGMEIGIEEAVKLSQYAKQVAPRPLSHATVRKRDHRGPHHRRNSLGVHVQAFPPPVSARFPRAESRPPEWEPTNTGKPTASLSNATP